MTSYFEYSLISHLFAHTLIAGVFAVDQPSISA